MCLYDVPTFNYYAYRHDTAQVACGRNYEKMGKITVQRLAQGKHLIEILKEQNSEVIHARLRATVDSNKARKRSDIAIGACRKISRGHRIHGEREVTRQRAEKFLKMLE